MGSIRKPLLPEEVPEEFRSRVVFNTCRLVPAKQNARISKNYTVIDVVCEVCGGLKQTSVNDIRNWIRGQKRGHFPSTHRACRYEGRYINHDGYEMIFLPNHPNAMGNGYVSGHILAMSNKLGRPLDTKNESVHHINGEHSDNRDDNLQLRGRYQGKGQNYQCLDCGSHNVGTVEL